MTPSQRRPSVEIFSMLFGIVYLTCFYLDWAPFRYYPDARAFRAKRFRNPFESRDRIFRFAAAPSVKFIDQRVVEELVPLAITSQHADRPRLG